MQSTFLLKIPSLTQQTFTYSNSTTLLLLLYCWLQTNCIPFNSVSIVNFEYVFVYWGGLVYWCKKSSFVTGWKVVKYRVFVGPYFPVFTSKLPYLNTFHAVCCSCNTVYQTSCQFRWHQKFASMLFIKIYFKPQKINILVCMESQYNNCV